VGRASAGAALMLAIGRAGSPGARAGTGRPATTGAMD
jgi:hypothetical protein